CFFFQAEDGIRDFHVTGVQTCALPISDEVEQLVGDRSTGDLRALEGRKWDVCIDNPTSLPFWVRDAGKALAGNIGHYLFISTISVYADGSKPGMDEDAPLAAYKGRIGRASSRERVKISVVVGNNSASVAW